MKKHALERSTVSFARNRPIRATASHSRILIVDDDPLVCELLSNILGAEGYVCRCANGGAEALSVLREWRAHMVILDVTLPGESGFEICRTLRAMSEVFILMLSSRTALVDRVVGIELGADDYMSKPFDTREFVARVKGLLRRARVNGIAENHAGYPVLHVGSWSFDINSRQLSTPLGRSLTLSKAESILLRVFLERPNSLITRKYLEQVLLWDEGRLNRRTIDMRVSRLRQSIGDDGRQPRLIRTVRNQGYFLVANL